MSGSTASAAYSGPPTINGITAVDADVLVISDGGTLSYPDYPNTVLVVQADGTVVGVSEIDADQVPTTLRSTTFPSLVVVGGITAATETVGSLTVTGVATIGTLSTTSLALSGTLSVAGATTLAACSVSSLTCSGAATIQGFTTVNDDLLVMGDVGARDGYFMTVQADDFIAGNNSSLAITSVTTFTATGPATMAAITCTTLAASGAVTVGGTLGVTGATTLATPVGINMAANTLRVLGATATGSNTAVHAVATSSGTAFFSVGRATFTANGVSNSYHAASALNAFYSSNVAWGLNSDNFDLGIKLGNNSSSTAVNQFTQIRMEQRAGNHLDRPILDLQAVRTTAATGEVALAVTGRDTGMASYTMRTSMMSGNQYCFFSPNTSTGWVSMLSQVAPTTGYKFGVGPSGSTATHSELNGNVLVRGTASFNSTLSVLGASTMAAVSATMLTASDRIYSNYAAASQMVFTPGTAASTFIRVEGPAGGVNRRISFIDPGSADRQVLYTDMAQPATLGSTIFSGGAVQVQIPGDGTVAATQELWFGQDAAGETQWRLLGANSSFGSNWRVRQRTGGVSNDRVIVSSAGTAIWSNLGIGKSPTANALDVLGATVLQALTCTTLAASGNTTVGGTLGVTGATTLAAVTCTTLTTSGNVTVGGTLSVTGAITFAAVACASLAVSGAVTVGTTLGVTGASTLAAVSCSSLSVSGNATVGGTLSVTGAVTFAAVACSSLAVSGAATVGTTLGVTGESTLAGGINLDATNYYTASAVSTYSMTSVNGFIRVYIDEPASGFVSGAPYLVDLTISLSSIYLQAGFPSFTDMGVRDIRMMTQLTPYYRTAGPFGIINTWNAYRCGTSSTPNTTDNGKPPFGGSVAWGSVGYIAGSPNRIFFSIDCGLSGGYTYSVRAHARCSAESAKIGQLTVQVTNA